MPAFARAILIQESAEGVLSYKAKKISKSHHRTEEEVTGQSIFLSPDTAS